jgi:hypothetical protein
MTSVHHLRDVPISDDYVPSAAFKTPLTLASSPHPGIMELGDSKAHTSSPQIPIEDEKLDHRRRRRNRMRASCLNCYASKRKVCALSLDSRPCSYDRLVRQEKALWTLYETRHREFSHVVYYTCTSSSNYQTGLCIYEVEDTGTSSM